VYDGDDAPLPVPDATDDATDDAAVEPVATPSAADDASCPASEGDDGAADGHDPAWVGEGDVHPADNDADDPPADPPADPPGASPGGGPSVFLRRFLAPFHPATVPDWHAPGGPGAPRPPGSSGGSGAGGRAPGSVWPLDYTRLLPRVTLYLHVHQDTVDDLVAGTGAGPGGRDGAAEGAGERDRSGTGVVRWEGHGPVTAQYVRDVLGPHAAFTIKPVIDLAGQVPVDGYEIPDRLREAVHLRTPADVFPYASSTRRGLDCDHTIPYDHGADTGSTARTAGDTAGKTDGDCAGNAAGDTGTAGGHVRTEQPGQTAAGNLGKLTRFHHRVKTHTAWQVRQPFPGIYVWRAPHGRYYLVDHTGTRKLGTDPTSGTPAGVVAHLPAAVPPITSPRDLRAAAVLEDLLTNQLLEHAAA
jgi:hypothetical protein